MCRPIRETVPADWEVQHRLIHAMVDYFIDEELIGGDLGAFGSIQDSRIGLKRCWISVTCVWPRKCLDVSHCLKC